MSSLTVPPLGNDAASSTDPPLGDGIAAPPPPQLVPAMVAAFDSLMGAVFKATASSAELVGPVQQFLLTAQRAEAYLLSWSRGARAEHVADDAALRAEIAALGAESEQKAALLAHYGERALHWAERYRQLEDDNARVEDDLYNTKDEHKR